MTATNPARPDRAQLVEWVVPIERLARMLQDEPGESTLGELAARFDQPIGRIRDALDVLKIRCGEPTTIPLVRWPG